MPSTSSFGSLYLQLFALVLPELSGWLPIAPQGFVELKDLAEAHSPHSNQCREAIGESIDTNHPRSYKKNGHYSLVMPIYYN